MGVGLLLCRAQFATSPGLATYVGSGGLEVGVGCGLRTQGGLSCSAAALLLTLPKDCMDLMGATAYCWCWTMGSAQFNQVFFAGASFVFDCCLVVCTGLWW